MIDGELIAGCIGDRGNKGGGGDLLFLVEIELIEPESILDPGERLIVLRDDEDGEEPRLGG